MGERTVPSALPARAPRSAAGGASPIAHAAPSRPSQVTGPSAA